MDELGREVEGGFGIGDPRMDGWVGFLIYLEFFICRRLSIYMHHVTKVSGIGIIIIIYDDRCK